MKWFVFPMLLALTACNNGGSGNDPLDDSSPIAQQQIPDIKKPVNAARDTATNKVQKTYANTRFKDVTVMKAGENTYRIRGKGQIFEASFGWVIEDGHNELAKGFAMTDAGAPEWGKFDFTVEAKKARANSTLHLILFETSAKDGSRVYELPVPLE
jgi:hypothetical protein